MGFARIVSVLALAATLQSRDAPAIARGGSEEFAQGKFAELIMRFDAQMKAAATEMLLRQTLMQLTGQVGAFEKVDASTDCKDAGTVTLCITPLLFEQGRILLRIAVNGEGQIAGLTIAGNQPRGGAGGTPPAASVAPPDRNIDVVTGNITIPGVLRLPDGPGPHPLIVLVHGSGAFDADETIGPNKPFRDLAEGLARQGVATLRYVKRNRVITLAASATFDEESVDDALSALRLARSSKGVDPKRVFILGHSLGGYLAPYIAAKDPQTRGVIIMAGNNRPLRESLTDQVRHLTGSEESLETVWQSMPARYQNGIPGYDAPSAARALPVPIFVLQGGRDYQVNEKDFARWTAALSTRKDVTLTLYPRLNHLFLEGDGKSMPAEYAVPGHVFPEVIDDIARWINGLR